MSKKIGFIGLGQMGLPMALNLCKNGYEVVVRSGFHHPDSEKSAVEAGAATVRSFQEMAEICDVIITMVPADKEILSLYSEEEILATAKEGLVCIDMTSAKGTTKVRIAEKIQAMDRGIHFIDAPVSGGVAGAKAGTLTIMVGSTEEEYAEYMDIFQAMGKKIFYTGSVGSGSNVKMLNQMLNAANTAIAAEVLCISRKLGVDDNILCEVVNQSSGASFIFEKNVPKYMLTGDHTPGFRLDLMKKDVGLFIDTAKEIQGFTPVSDLVSQLYQAVSNQGAGNMNYTYIHQWLSDCQKEK